MALETKFLAPRTVMVPRSGVPPWTVRTSLMRLIVTHAAGRPEIRATRRVALRCGLTVP